MSFKSSINDNDEITKENLYCIEELQLLIAKYINNNSTYIELSKYLGDINESEKKFVRKSFETELLKFVKAEIKNEMTILVSNEEREFILEARNQLVLNSKFFDKWTTKLKNNDISLKDERLGDWISEFHKFFYLLESRFIPSGPEETLKSLIIEWFEAGEMSLEVWKEWSSWFTKGMSLKVLKKIAWPNSSQNDAVKPKFIRALANIHTNNLIDQKGFKKVLQLYLEEPKIEIEMIEHKDQDGKKHKIKTNVLNVIGKTIFLSTIKERIEKLVQKEAIEQMDIVARNTFHIDVDLMNDVWKGKNISIVADKVNVWGSRVFDVSGKGFKNNERRKAKNGLEYGGPGRNGRDGEPGESSGNITIITEEMTNPTNLTLYLVGGNGEDGESGGDGGDGKNGKGITKEDFDKIALQYSSLYKASWTTFQHYAPKEWKQTRDDCETNDDYIWYEFKDSDGRELYYTYGADRGWVYNWYELVIWIKGTDGTAGGMGGLNGTGGEGGNRGEFIVTNFASDIQYPVEKVQANGKNGKNGNVGENGKSGTNGNHIAMIDRSAKGKNKHYFGIKEPLTRLKIKWFNENSRMRRINRYRYAVEDETACFGEFQYCDIPLGGLCGQKRTKKEERSSKSATTMKKSIVTNKIMEKAQEHKSKMDSAIDAAVQSIKCKVVMNLAIDETIEETETAEQEQEVVVVKEVNEDQLEITRSKARKSKLTPMQFIQKVNEKRIYEGCSMLAQEIIDYFLIEFNYELLAPIKLRMLRRCSRFRCDMENLFKRTIIAAIQAKKIDGLSFMGLRTLANQTSKLVVLKHRQTEFRHNVSQFSTDDENFKYDIDETLTKTDDNKLRNVKFIAPDICQIFNKNAKIEDKEAIIKGFFRDYRLNEVNSELLLALYLPHELMKFRFAPFFEPLKDDTIEWGNNESWEKAKERLIETESSVEDIIQLIKNEKIWFKKNFTNLSKIINSKLTKNIGSINELEIRFGHVPDFEEGVLSNISISNIASDENVLLKPAHFLIRFYWQIEKLIEFNRRLMTINLIAYAEKNNFEKSVMEKYLKLDVKDLIAEIKINNGIKMESNECQEYITHKGFQSMAFRFLISVMQNKKIEIYGNERYGTIEMIESWDGDDLLQLYYNGTSYFKIAPDIDLRKLIAFRNKNQWKIQFDENKHRLRNAIWDYTKLADKKQFAAYFLPSFFQTICEWIDCYLAFSQNDSIFLRMLHERFEIDGNHLGIADFQFIISTAILLQSQYNVSSDYILNLASSISQHKLIDTFFITRLESQWRKQLKNSTKIHAMLELITNNRFKILLATKIDENDDIEIDEKILKKFLLMLQHTSTNNTELEKMSLTEWKLVSDKQKYFDISDAVKDFGSVGYYIIYLKQQEKKESDLLEKLLANSKMEYHIPEKLIAQVCSLIINHEVNFDEKYLKELDKLLIEITKFSVQEKIGRHIFITDELEQVNMIKKVQNSESYKKVITEKIRTIDVIAELIKGVQDKKINEKIERRKNSQRIVSIIKNPIHAQNRILNEINNCIIKLRPGFKGLRDTQRMAIMYAIENNKDLSAAAAQADMEEKENIEKIKKNLLCQVSTGEGKSYIVVATAIIRTKQYNYVDIITSSSVLAQRDAAAMKDIYEAMGVNVDHNCYEDLEKRKQAYKANVVYGEIGRFQRDYLLHNFYRKNILGDRERQNSCAIVDEVDNMCLDNGNNMLYLSHSVPGMDLIEPLFVHLQKLICFPFIKKDKDKALANETIKSAILSDLLGRISINDIELMANTPKAQTSCFSVWSYLINEHFIDSEGYLNIAKDEFNQIEVDIFNSLKNLTTPLHAKKIITCFKAVLNRRREISIPAYLIPFIRRHLIEYIENAKRAIFMNPNEAYVVDVDHTKEDTDITPKVTIIDQNTGVDLATSQWSEGLHQCVQIKHGCRVNPISMKAVFISNVKYLKDYAKLNGLSGTLGSIEESTTLSKLYDADLIKIPTFQVKRLYEHVPVITKTEDEWIDSIFAEIIDQINASRSILVICRSISEVLNIKKSLIERYSNLDTFDTKIIDCFSNITVYQREFDDFDFGDDNKLKSGQLIIATNLAGRGTDIKLSRSLREAGGLHVIVSFLPENSRIEDQAYGRAARSGDPGSGQIIAITNRLDATGQAPSVFDLKIFRDNAEVQRLKSMTDYYKFHTKIEESCLQEFKEHCLAALGNMNDSKRSDNGVPTKEEVIYFALLDEWAIWLDSQSAAIKQCAQDKSEKQKSDIILSVRTFLYHHPISLEKN